MNISVSEQIYQACPRLRLGIISCDVVNTSSDEALWEEIAAEEESLRLSMRMEEIARRIPIYETRQAYKKLGKDPNRYRPSAEALCRRILKGYPLYKIDTLVDLINLVSIRTGYSIGGFDAGKIKGDLILGVGQADELFNGIGRGPLNIEGLPVYRDEQGGIGTPTSDEERTKIDLSTTKLLMIINGYSGEEGLMEAVAYAKDLLEKYATARNIQIETISPVL
ncbi:MAG: phenylalanine--tRNA ligase beta subunit-related protein [Parabacteroides sp.]|nr:phenylalanine--tRNA ligase beta subunit-related protein [Parabacteroides sp.]